MRSIYVRLNGGLGNQLFQFAAGYALSKKINSSLYLDCQLYQISEFDNYKRECEIDKVINPKDFTLISSTMFLPSRLWKLKRLFYTLLHEIGIQKYRFIRENKSGFDKNFFLLLNDNLFLDGYWQSEKYFFEYKDEVKNIFNIFFHTIPKYLDLYKGICLKNSVCVDIRKGDYVSSFKKLSVHGELSDDYYKKCIDRIEILIESPEYFIFCDNINDIPSPFKSKSCHIVDVKHFGENYHNKLRLMTLCSNFIIPNSTFTWWAAYMCKNKNKIIIGPENWVKNKNNMYRMPKKWIKVGNDV